MTFGEKLRETRIALNLSQMELSRMTGLSTRSLYTYEQLGIIPRNSNLKKLAEALNVSPDYLLDENVTDHAEFFDQGLLIDEVKKEYGARGAREAHDILERAGVLLAGGELDDAAKDAFFQSLMEVYLDSKKNAKDKFTAKKYRVSRKRRGNQPE
jgi:transcriptional regulator with XRE-family HTH domain